MRAILNPEKSVCVYKRIMKVYAKMLLVFIYLWYKYR